MEQRTAIILFVGGSPNSDARSIEVGDKGVLL
jgi:hypothetical protein